MKNKNHLEEMKEQMELNGNKIFAKTGVAIMKD